MAMNKKRLLVISILILWTLASGREAKAQKGDIPQLRRCVQTNCVDPFRDFIPCSLLHAICMSQCLHAFDGTTPFGANPTVASPGAAVLADSDPDREADPPTCKTLLSGPPTGQLGVQDTGSGLLSIRILEAVNANVSVSPFQPGTHEQVVVTGTRQDLSKPGRFLLLALDFCSNAAFCDPVMTSTVRTTGKPVTDSYPNLPQEEGFVTISNGSPGVRTVQITVNGTRFKAVTLKDGEERTLNVSSAMLPGDTNIITLRSTGQPGGSADVLIWDGVGAGIESAMR
jgi:hypothetical protein